MFHFCRNSLRIPSSDISLLCCYVYISLGYHQIRLKFNQLDSRFLSLIFDFVILHFLLQKLQYFRESENKFLTNSKIQ